MRPGTRRPVLMVSLTCSESTNIRDVGRPRMSRSIQDMPAHGLSAGEQRRLDDDLSNVLTVSRRPLHDGPAGRSTAGGCPLDRRAVQRLENMPSRSSPGCCHASLYLWLAIHPLDPAYVWISIHFVWYTRVRTPSTARGGSRRSRMRVRNVVAPPDSPPSQFAL